MFNQLFNPQPRQGCQVWDHQANRVSSPLENPVHNRLSGLMLILQAFRLPAPQSQQDNLQVSPQLQQDNLRVNPQLQRGTLQVSQLNNLRASPLVSQLLSPAVCQQRDQAPNQQGCPPACQQVNLPRHQLDNLHLYHPRIQVVNQVHNLLHHQQVSPLHCLLRCRRSLGPQPWLRSLFGRSAVRP